MIKYEPFAGKYHGGIPSTELPSGFISDGLNIRKRSGGIGWKPRKGCALHNTTTIGGTDEVHSLHQYTNPRSEDYHFLAQCNDLLYDATNDPSASGTTFGTSLGVAASDAKKGFSCQVGEYWFYADGLGRPVVWGGDTPYPMAFYVEDESEDAFIAYSREVMDERSDTKALVLEAAADAFYVLSQEPISGVALTLDDVNSNAVTIVVKAWRSGAWTAVAGTSDGTNDGTGTLEVNGTISWTASASDTMRVVGKDLGYAYQFTWSGALSGTVEVESCTVIQAASLLTNKWDGVFNWMTNCLFYDESEGLYVDGLGKVGNETTAQYLDLSDAVGGASWDYLYIKTPEPATGFGIGVAPGYINTEDAQIDQISYWNGSDWTTVGTVTDSTLDETPDSSFAQTGRLFFNGTAIDSKMRTFGGDNNEGHWYQIRWDADLSTDTRIYAVYYAPLPDSLPLTEGVEEFKGRLVTWGDPEFPNKLRISSSLSPFCFSGSDSLYTRAFGSMKPITRAKKFYNELMVFKDQGVFLLEGYSPETFGSLRLTSRVGLASPKSLQVIETGYDNMHTDEDMTIAIWQDVDGVYVSDGRKPKKVSNPVDHYFNPESASCIAAGDIKDLDSYVDYANNEYHLLLPTSELVYNYVLDEWYPIWEREIDLTCGLTVRGTDDRDYLYGGTAVGLVMRLETDTSDKDAANADATIEHSVKTRGLSTLNPEEETPNADLDVGRIWIRGKAQTSGSLVTKIFPDMASAGTTITAPAGVSMVNSGKAMFVDWVEAHQQRVNSFELEFSEATQDVEMELWGFGYEIDGLGANE